MRTVPISLRPTKKELISFLALARLLRYQPTAVVSTIYPTTIKSSAMQISPIEN